MDSKMMGAASNFNWDDIEVGNGALDHSQNFFARKHIKHERLDELEHEAKLLQKLELSNLGNSFIKPNNNCIENKENDKRRHSAELNVPRIKKEFVENPSPSKAKQPLSQLHYVEKNMDLKSTQKPITNITRAWSTERIVTAAVHTGTVAKSAPLPPPPNVYQFKDFYQRRKEEALRKQLEEERKLREFHSRPMPDYATINKQQTRRKGVHAITVPVTPVVLKKSREGEERKKKKVEEIKLQMKPPKIEARPATVLKEQPFVPKKTSTAIMPCPFNLHSEKRLQERKLFDAATQRATEEKRKQEERERRKQEEHRVKELRKLTKFKARPNPFKQ